MQKKNEQFSDKIFFKLENSTREILMTNFKSLFFLLACNLEIKMQKFHNWAGSM